MLLGTTINSTMRSSTLLLLCCASAAMAQETAPARTTHWELSGGMVNRYIEDSMMCNTGASPVAREEGTPWHVSAGYRTGNGWVFTAGFEHSITRHGQGMNNEFVCSDTVSSLFGPIITTTYRADQLTTEQTVNTIMLQAGHLLKQQQHKRTVWLTFRGEFGLRVHQVVAEQGVCVGRAAEYHYNSLWNPEPGDPDLDRMAIGNWGYRQVVHQQRATGLSLFPGFRADLHCTRYFSLYVSVGMNIPLVKPQFDAYAVPHTNMEFPAYRVNLSAMRSGFGAAVHF